MCGSTILVLGILNYSLFYSGTGICPMERLPFSDLSLRTPKNQSWFRCRTPPNRFGSRGVFKASYASSASLTDDTYVCLSAASSVCDGVWHCPDGSDELCVLGYNRALLLLLLLQAYFASATPRCLPPRLCLCLCFSFLPALAFIPSFSRVLRCTLRNIMINGNILYGYE